MTEQEWRDKIARDYVDRREFVLTELAFRREKVRADYLIAALRAIPDDRPIGAINRVYEDGISLGSRHANEHWREWIEYCIAGEYPHELCACNHIRRIHKAGICEASERCGCKGFALADRRERGSK